VPLPREMPDAPLNGPRAARAPSASPRRVDRVLYLHGFASSAKSTKAGWFAGRLQEHGIDLQAPDFNEPDFATLTMTRMLEQVDRAIGDADGRVALIGSSLGGTLAVLAASRFPRRIDRLVLLAPAVMFAKAGHHLLPPERIAEWRRAGALPFFHYGHGGERPLNDAFDARFDQPALVFQGLHDSSVDYRTVEAFAAGRPNVTLSLLDDDHQLIASLPRMWHDIQPFFGLVE
jgi:uncharacterized protein